MVFVPFPAARHDEREDDRDPAEGEQVDEVVGFARGAVAGVSPGGGGDGG